MLIACIAKELNNRIQKIPALDITSEELILNDKPFGKMELIANNDKNDWHNKLLDLIKSYEKSISAVSR